MSWPEPTLGELCSKIGSGATPRGGNKSYKQSGTALVRSMNVHMGRFEEKNLAFIDDKQASALGNVALEPDDVLLNITGASVARCCLLDSAILPARVNQHVCILRPDRDVLNPTYLMRFLTSSQAQRLLLAAAGSGATREAITKAELQKFPIPLPPLPEQRRIAAILDKADALRAKRREAIAKCDQLLQSVFHHVLGCPENWHKAALSELCEADAPITYGILQPGPDYEGGVLYVRPSEIKNGQIVKESLRRTDPAIAKRYSKSALRADDILITIVGTIGSIAVVPNYLEGANITQSSARIRIAPTKADRLFVELFLRSIHAKRQYEAARLGVAVERLNLHHVRDLQVPLPPKPIQTRIAKNAEGVLSIRKGLSESLGKLELLNAAVQSSAFSEFKT